jgi:hypothetical protein
MHLRTSLLGFFALAASTWVGCVVHNNPPGAAPPAAAATPAAAPAAAPAATPAATTAPTAAPAAAPEDPNAEIQADSDDPPAVADPLPKQETVEPPPATPGMPEETAAGIADGKPAGLEPGAPAGFWIWKNPAGVWKVRTTTAKKLHEFKGRVKGVQKPIGKVRPSRTEFGDRIKRGTGGEIMFRFHTKGHVDGFDFRAPKDTCIRFDLQLDTGATAKKVHIGKDKVSPKSNHFTICPAK